MCLAFQTMGNSEHWQETIRNNAQHLVKKVQSYFENPHFSEYFILFY